MKAHGIWSVRQIERGRSDVNVPWRRSKADITHFSCMYEQYIARYSCGIFPIRILPGTYSSILIYTKQGASILTDSERGKACED
jgi:hypothetical protein